MYCNLASVHFTECLYVLEEGGRVTVFNTSLTPSPVTAHWTAPASLGRFTCLAHYEQTMDEVQSTNRTLKCYNYYYGASVLQAFLKILGC